MTMKKRKLQQKLAKILVSVFVLAIFMVPTFMTVRWVAGMTGIGQGDGRPVVTVEPLATRMVDKSNQPLKPFKEPLFSVTFDDGWESIYSEGLPILQQYGIRTTQYILSGTLDDKSYMSVAQLRSMQAAGHEMASHTISHADLTALNQHQVEMELRFSKDDLSKQLGPIRDFASPLGAFDADTLKLISVHYRSHKTTKGDPVPDGTPSINIGSDFTPMIIKAYTVRNHTTLDDLRQLLESAKLQNGWVVLTYHQIDYSGSLYSVTPEVFAEQMRLVSDSDLRSATIGQVLGALGVN